MSKRDLFLKATKAVEASKKEADNHIEKVMNSLKEFSSKHPELKGEDLLIAFRDSGCKYSECWNDDEPFEYAYSL